MKIEKVLQKQFQHNRNYYVEGKYNTIKAYLQDKKEQFYPSKAYVDHHDNRSRNVAQNETRITLRFEDVDSLIIFMNFNNLKFGAFYLDSIRNLVYRNVIIRNSCLEPSQEKLLYGFIKAHFNYKEFNPWLDL